MKSLLVRILGFPATLIHGDTLVLDRWLWLKRHLPDISSGSKRLLDVGCGTGAFTIGAARRGYWSLGLSWDGRNQAVAQQRSSICRANLARFEVQDLRHLERRVDLQHSFDIVVCCETIEHIINDRKLIIDLSRCLKSGGLLLLTTPYFHYIPMTKSDEEPFSRVEDGGHVRRGYTLEDLKDLCKSGGLRALEIGYCSGFVSQKTTALLRTICKVNSILGWCLILPLRVLPPLCDRWISEFIHWPEFTITLVAAKR